jgi:hypothetical protein
MPRGIARLSSCAAKRGDWLYAACRERRMNKQSMRLSGVYRLLEPGPVVMVTTAAAARANIMTLSWHMMMDFEPPLVACVASGRNHSFAALRATKEMSGRFAEITWKLVDTTAPTMGNCRYSARHAAATRTCTHNLECSRYCAVARHP